MSNQTEAHTSIRLLAGDEIDQIMRSSEGTAVKSRNTPPIVIDEIDEIMNSPSEDNSSSQKGRRAKVSQEGTDSIMGTGQKFQRFFSKKQSRSSGRQTQMPGRRQFTFFRR